MRAVDSAARRGYPAKPPFGRDPDGVAEISMTLTVILADMFALYVKTKNFHWHMAGSHFRDYHLLFDEQAEQIFAMIDVLAERCRKLGQLTIHSIGQIHQLQNIQDDNDTDLSGKQMIQRLL